MYKEILENTLKTLAEVTLCIPESGKLAGKIICKDGDAARKMAQADNLHYPMGTAYLKFGIPGVSKRARQSSENNKNKLLPAIAEVYDGLSAMLLRFSAEVMKKSGEDKRLFRIGENLRSLSERAPVHFEEALQLVAVMWSLRTLVYDGAAIGRLDVHLNPFFENDIEKGYITEDEVLELLCDFWKLINNKCSGDTLNNVMVGGSNPDGTNAGSRLSVLMLKATKKCAMSEPHINVRVHQGIRDDIYDAMLEVQAMGQGQATVYNDEVIVPGLLKYGIPREIAYSYANDGCTEVVFDGYGGIDFCHIDAVATFELSFNNGKWAERSYRKPVKYWKYSNQENYYTPDALAGFESGKIENCETFDEFYRQFLNQYEFQTRVKANMVKRMEDDRKAGCATSVFLNGTYDFILDSGKDILCGGFPVMAYMLFSGSIPTVADCLVSVKKLVFEEKKYSVEQIKEAIRVNFEGYETMRLEMVSMPKFGNDIDEVDFIAADIANHFCCWLEKFREETAFPIMPALVGWRFLEEAYGIAATPDGRYYGDPIAEHFCATPGKAQNGPTSHINSIAKAKAAIGKAIGVCAVHITLPKNGIEENIMIIDFILKSALKSGLNQINIAIYDKELLRKAQADPEKYQDVIVRVWGYSAKFADLCDEMQEHIIKRIQ